MIQGLLIERNCNAKTRSTKTSMKLAIHGAQQMGFIYEDRKACPFTWYQCFPTSLSSLLDREALGETEILCMSDQPVDTGDPYTAENMGYVPHAVRMHVSPTIQSCRSMDFHGRELVTTAIDYSLLRGWIRNCKSKCHQALEEFNKDRKRFQRISFRLLDCLKRDIVNVPAKRQLRCIALSYV